MNTSKYIQISDWCLIEYEYSNEYPKKLNYDTTDVGIYKLINNKTGEYQFINVNNNITNNNLYNNLIPTNFNQSLLATYNIISDNNENPNYSNYDLIDLSNNINNHNLYYDTIRLHILSGYNFENIDAFSFDVNIIENSNKKVKLSNFYYPKSGNYINNQNLVLTLNPNPIVVAERTYDKYVTLLVPSLHRILEDQLLYSNPPNTSIFSYLYSHPVSSQNPNNGGIKSDSTIYVNLCELEISKTNNNIEYYSINNKYTATILPADAYSNLSCIIKEADNGDYFEYYPIYDGGFINDYLYNLNSVNNMNWSVIHNIQVIEQVADKFYVTSDMTIPQSTNFDRPSYFRPVLLYSDISFSYTIAYTMRFVNSANGEQIIRKSTLTSYNPKKYGLNINRIKIDDGIEPLKVYNKISNDTIIINNTLNKRIYENNIMINTKYINLYTNVIDVCININNVNINENSDLIYGQGYAKIRLNKFDNLIKFKIQKYENGYIIPIDLTNKNIVLKFLTDNLDEITILKYDDDNITIFPESGEIMFLIDKKKSNMILKNKKEMNFYIIDKSSEIENVIYTGKFIEFKNGEDIDADYGKPIKLKIKEYEDILTKEINNYKLLNKKLSSVNNIEVSKLPTYSVSSSIKETKKIAKVENSNIIKQIKPPNI